MKYKKNPSLKKDNRELIAFYLPKEDKEKIIQHCNSSGIKNLSAYCRYALFNFVRGQRNE